MNFDLHTHSNCSHDSKVPPQDLLALAEQAGLDYFSITDHNSAKAHRILKDPALRACFGGKMIAGTELSATFHKVNVEILGYGFDPDVMQKNIERHWMPNTEKYRYYRKVMIESCLKAGAKLDPAKVEAFLQQDTPCRRELLALLKEFPENRRLLLFDESWTNMSSFLRQETNNPKSPLFADLSGAQVSPETAAKLIRESGGVVFLAHPLIYSAEATDHLSELIDRVQPDGLECFYPAFTPAQIEHLLSICQERKLYAGGGSDHHGATRPNPLGEYGQFQARAAKEVSKWIDQIQTY